MNRRAARELAMKCVFQMEAQNEFEKENAEKLLRSADMGEQKEYILRVIDNICKIREVVDEAINACSKGWPVSRMAKADLAIIRVAACEILFMDDIPKAVAINEGVELAKRYGSDQSPAFINAVLKKIG